MRNPKCEFTNCIHYSDGFCHDTKARKNCVEMAIGILCLGGYRNCPFCADLRFNKTMLDEKCERYNKKDKVGMAKARVGVKYTTYLTDYHKRINEETSKTYKLVFCPVCGRLIRL